MSPVAAGTRRRCIGGAVPLLLLLLPPRVAWTAGGDGGGAPVEAPVEAPGTQRGRRGGAGRGLGPDPEALAAYQRRVRRSRPLGARLCGVRALYAVPFCVKHGCAQCAGCADGPARTQCKWAMHEALRVCERVERLDAEREARCLAACAPRPHARTCTRARTHTHARPYERTLRSDMGYMRRGQCRATWSVVARAYGSITVRVWRA